VLRLAGHCGPFGDLGNPLQQAVLGPPQVFDQGCRVCVFCPGCTAACQDRQSESDNEHQSSFHHVEPPVYCAAFALLATALSWPSVILAGAAETRSTVDGYQQTTYSNA